jgi:hypothetical protein
MARRLRRASMAIVLFGVGAILSGCTNFDPENFTDMFNLNKKEKLPGERRPLFPEGVPGVTQGVPPHLVKGQQPPPEAEISAAPAPAAAPEKPKAAAKPKPRTASRPARVTVSPDQQQQSGANAPSSSPWPAPAAQQPAPNASPSSSPWPSAPPSGTFQR